MLSLPKLFRQELRRIKLLSFYHHSLKVNCLHNPKASYQHNPKASCLRNLKACYLHNPKAKKLIKTMQLKQ